MKTRQSEVYFSPIVSQLAAQQAVPSFRPENSRELFHHAQLSLQPSCLCGSD
jgi:hypothetical protein